MNKIEFKDLPSTETPIDSDNLNLLQDNVEDEFDIKDAEIGDLNSLNTTDKSSLVGAINETNSKFDISNITPILSSCINNENTNISFKEIDNLLILSGVLYFTSKPGTWTKFIEFPNGLLGNGYGSLTEEPTGLVRPIIIQNNSEIVMSADLSTIPIYTYINITFTKE